MAKKTIMLVCSAGMSTSLLVTKMQKAAEAKGLEADIFAVSASEADQHLESKDVNVLLLGPQVRFMKGDFEKRLAPKGIPLEVINMADYGMMNDENAKSSRSKRNGSRYLCCFSFRSRPTFGVETSRCSIIRTTSTIHEITI